MGEFYLRVDAVNLAHFVNDTHDISTMRGGSYILLAAIEKLKDKFKGRIQPVSTAASQGIFSFDCPEGEDACPEKFRQEILAFLHEETQGHATFVVAVEKSIDDFPLLLEKLEAQVHRLQWRFPTVAVPAFPPTDQECYLDGWRPGIEPYRADPQVKNARVSACTQFRREEGRKLKHKLFHELLGEEKYKDSLTARDLEQLARDSSRGNLNGKIAYIYIDGNSFGGIRRKLCKTRETREEFDRLIQDGFRKPFLKSLLQNADNDPAYQTKDDAGRDALRIEILLWGGDEMVLVVPAWKGLEVLQLFYQMAASLSFEGMSLSHRAAVIFCHQNMPILQIRQVAESLLLLAKNDIKKDLAQLCLQDPAYREYESGRKDELVSLACDHHGDIFHYLVLESVDVLGGSLDAFLQKKYRGVASPALMVHGSELPEMLATIQMLKADLAFGNVFEVAQNMQAGDGRPDAQAVERMETLVPPERREVVKAALESLTGNHPERWYTLVDLWDYVAEENSHE